MIRLCICCILVAAACPIWLCRTSVADTLDVIALSGQLVPNSDGENLFSTGFLAPILHDNGDILFQTTISGDRVNASNNSTLWIRRTAGTLQKIASEGETPLGVVDGAAFSRFQNPVLKGNGIVSFEGTLMGPAGDEQGIWRWREGFGLEQVARKGSKDADGATIRSIYEHAMNNNGDVTFSGSANGKGFGVWVEQEGELHLLASSGTELPQGDDDLSFGIFDQPVFNDKGDVAFHSSLVGTNLDANNDDAVWVYQDGQGLRQVARAGTAVPRTAEDTLLKGIYPDVVLNNEGSVAFAALLTGPDIDLTRSTGVWVQRGGRLETLAVASDPAPEIDGDVKFERLSAFAINDASDMVLKAALVGPGVTVENNQGIWVDRDGGGLGKLVRKGDPAPGTDAGINFNVLYQPLINGNGEVALMATTTEQGRLGIWAEDRNGLLTLIAEEGGLLDVADGPPEDLRTISRLSLAGGFSGNSNSVGGRSTGFNQLGQVAFLAGFTDGSTGVFVSNLVAVPEPNAFLLAAMHFFAVLQWSRMRTKESVQP